MGRVSSQPKSVLQSKLGQIAAKTNRPLAPALSSFFDVPQRAREFTEKLQTRLAQASALKGNQAIVLVTHRVNILDYMGENVGSSVMVLVHYDAQGKLLKAQRYPSP